MMRYARQQEIISILRALAVLNDRGVGDLWIAESSRHRPLPGSQRAHLDVEYNSEAFVRVVGGLRSIGTVRTERLFQRHRGPGEKENVAQDGALEFFDTLARCAEAGYPVDIVHPHPGRPANVAPEDEVLTFAVHVDAQAFYGLRPPRQPSMDRHARSRAALSADERQRYPPWGHRYEPVVFVWRHRVRSRSTVISLGGHQDGQTTAPLYVPLDAGEIGSMRQRTRRATVARGLASPLKSRGSPRGMVLASSRTKGRPPA